MRPKVRYMPALLLAIFWFAQVQSVVHEIGHLATASQAQKSFAAPDASYCSQCLALAQAGAAPVSSPPSPQLPSARQIAVTSPTCAVVQAVSLAYRSRAPPTSPI